MMYKVLLQKQPHKYYSKADKPTARRMASAFEQLENNPKGLNTKQLKGKLDGFWRIRVGSTRIVYSIDDVNEIVNVLRIAPRGDVY